jgi:hypothetical protein
MLIRIDRWVFLLPHFSLVIWSLGISLKFLMKPSEFVAFYSDRVLILLISAWTQRIIRSVSAK